ncbi:MAG: hypothetical protein S0880_32335 [Actinomycetota bacterium]|nr:hypothetical protein [Actinomycetota bacterium]
MIDLLWSLRHGHPELVLCAVAVTLAAIGAVEAVLRSGGSGLRHTGPGTRTIAAALLVGCACLWLVANAPIEGPVLLPLSHNHGITVADLLALPLLGAAWTLVRGDEPAERATR